MTKKGKLKYLKLDEIIVGERFRREYDVEDLAESIKDKGVLQPITVDQNLRLVAGGRRLKAAQDAGLKEIPALIRETADDIEYREIELIENIEREDLTWLERTMLVQEIDSLYKQKHGSSWSGRKTAELLSRSHGSVHRTLQLAKGLQIIPELRECRTEDEAFRKLKKMEESALVSQLRKGQEAKLSQTSEQGQPQFDADVSDENAAERVGKATDREHEDRWAKAINSAKSHFRVGDAFDGLEELAELYRTSASAIRLLEVDPPFGVGLLEQKKRADKKDKLGGYEEIPAENYPDFLQRLAPLTYSIAASNAWCVFWYGPTWSYEVRQALENVGWHVDHIPAVWVKGEEESEGSGQSGSPERYLGRATEFFYVCRKGNPLLAREGRTNVFSHKPVPPSYKYHPTQKPVDLYRDILTTFAFPGTVVCSPFLGSGGILRAVYMERMLGFGWDLNESTKDRFLIAVESDLEAMAELEREKETEDE